MTRSETRVSGRPIADAGNARGGAGGFTPLWLWWPSKITKIPNVGPLIDYVEKLLVRFGPDLFPGAFGELNPTLLLPFIQFPLFFVFPPTWYLTDAGA